MNRSTTWYAVRPQSIAWDRLLGLIGVTALLLLWPASGVPQCVGPDCADNPVSGGEVPSSGSWGTRSSTYYASAHYSKEQRHRSRRSSTRSEDGGGGGGSGGGDCGNECGGQWCPPPIAVGFVSDPIVLPGGQFAHVETDFSMVERGARFVIQRSHLGGDFVDTPIVADHDNELERGRNNLFGTAWNSTLQMYSYWGFQGAGIDPNKLSQRFNLGGYYAMNVVIDPNYVSNPDDHGFFGGPASSNWFQFTAYEGCMYVPFNVWYRNPGVLTARDGTRYYFDCSCECGVVDPNHARNAFVQLLRRKENKYGVGYDYEYTKVFDHPNWVDPNYPCAEHHQSGPWWLTTDGTIQYLLTKVTTPAGREILFHYDDASEPNHVSRITLPDGNELYYEYYPKNYSDPNCASQLKRVRNQCACGGSGGERRYEYVRQTIRKQAWRLNTYAYSITVIRDGNDRVLVRNVYEPDSSKDDPDCAFNQSHYCEPPQRVKEQYVGDDKWTLQYDANTPEPNLMRITVTDPNGGVTIYICNDQGKLVSKVQQGSGNSGWRNYAYNDWNGLVGATRPDDANETYEYDAQGRLTRTIVRDANGVTYASEELQYSDFNSFSQVLRRIEPNEPNDPNRCESYEYDIVGNRVAMTGPRVTKGLAEGLSEYQPVDRYWYVYHGDPNHAYDPNYAKDPNFNSDANYPGNWGLKTYHVDPNGVVTRYEYNEYGYLIKEIVDYGGQNLTHTFEVDALGRRTKYTDPNGVITECTFTPAGEPNRIIMSDGYEWRFVYEPNTGFLQSESTVVPAEDPNNDQVVQTITYTRDRFGRVTTQIEGGVGQTDYQYDAMGRLWQTISPRGLVTENVYDTLGRLDHVKEGDSVVSTYDEYDAMNRVRQMTRYDDPNNPTADRTYKYGLDAMGRETCREEPDGTRFYTEYDTVGRVTREYVKDPNGAFVSDTTSEYDELGRLWRRRDKINPGGSDDPNHDRIVSTYRYRDGKVQKVQVGADGTPNVTRYHYDGAGRLEDTDLPGGTHVHTTYYPNGEPNVQTASYADGTVRKVEYTRDLVGRIEEMRHYFDPNLPRDANLPAYETTSFTYWPTGQIKTQTDPRQMVTYYQYNAQGKPTEIRENNNPTDANYGPRITEYVYDPNNGDLSEFVGHNSGGQQQKTTYGYTDKRGNVTSIDYPNGDKVTMTYDRAGRPLTRSVAGGATIGYKYDGRGFLQERSSGNTVDTFAYDALGRMTKATRTVNSEVASEVGFSYDALGRVLSGSLTIGGVTKTVQYPDHDQSDRRLKMILPDAEVVLDYAYTDAGQVDTIRRGTTNLVDYDYQGPAVSRRLIYSPADPNIHVTWQAYRDGLLRPTESANARTDPGDPNAEILWASYRYTRSPMGLPSRETFALFQDPNGTPRLFDYDELGRLKQVTYGADPNHSPREAFGLDLAGNRRTYIGRNGQQTTYTLDPNGANQYTHLTPPDANVTYDAAGNLAGDHRGYEYVHDHDNNLIEIKKGGATKATFQYDALGRRVRTVDYTRTPAVTRYYLSSGLNEVAEYNESGQRVRYYVHGATYIDERVIMHDDATNRDYIYLLKDLYTVAGLANERGWPVERYDYDAYGQVQMSRCAVLPYAADFDGDGDVDGDDLAILKQCYEGSGNEPNSYGGLAWIADLDGDGDVDGSDYVQFVYAYNGSGNPPRGAASPSVSLGSTVASRVGNPYFFTGRRLDVLDISNNGTPRRFTDDVPGLAIYDFRARTMDPVLGRFLQRDPFEYVDGMGLYEYCGSNPVMFMDPFGLDWFDDVSNFSAGLGDAIWLNIPRMIRNSFPDTFDQNYSSGAYSYGEWGGYAYSFAMGLGRLAYAGAAKAGSIVLMREGRSAGTAIIAMERRNMWKKAFNAGLVGKDDLKTAKAMFASYGDDWALWIARSGKTSTPWNLLGALLFGNGSYGLYDKACD